MAAKYRLKTITTRTPPSVVQISPRQTTGISVTINQNGLNNQPKVETQATSVSRMGSRKFADEVVKAHNDCRERHQVPAVSYSAELSTTAQHWADHLARTNTFQHSDASVRGQRVGENIAMKWSSRPESYTGKDVTEQWYEEIKAYQFGSEPRTLGCGHFTQVVWKSSREVGVGKAQTRDGKIIVVANYRPAGNVIGQFRENVPPPRTGSGLRSSPSQDKPANLHQQTTTFNRQSPTPARFTPPNAFNNMSSSSTSESVSIRTRTERQGDVTWTIVEETRVGPDGRKVVTTKKTSSKGNSDVVSKTKGWNDDFDKKFQSRFENMGFNGKSDDKKSPRSSSKPSEKTQTISEFIDDCVKAHNTVRSKHGVSSLKHAKDLTEHAQTWAEYLARSNSFKHSACVLRTGDRVGENIACKWSSGGSDYTGQDVADYWYSEVKKHDFKASSALNSGHFSQMVWKASREIGLGKARDGSGKVIIVANYRPAGNIAGQYQSNVFPSK